MSVEMWLVIGYGNSLRSDDAFGYVVAERLKENLADGDYPCLEVLSASQLRPEWSEPISRASAVIFVDASADLSPGELRCSPLIAMNATSTAGGSFTHQLTPEILLGFADILYGKSPPAWVVLAGGENFDFGELLSDSVNDLVPQVLTLIKHKISTFKQSTKSNVLS